MFTEPARRLTADATLCSAALTPTGAAAPAYPGTLSNLPPGFAPPRQSINTVDPDFSTQYTILSNVQIERAIGADLSVGLGYVNSTGRAMPVIVDTNLIPTAASLGDGRPIFSTAVNATTRVNPVFDHVNAIQSLVADSIQPFTLTPR